MLKTSPVPPSSLPPTMPASSLAPNSSSTADKPGSDLTRNKPQLRHRRQPITTEMLCLTEFMNC